MTPSLSTRQARREKRSSYSPSSDCRVEMSNPTPTTPKGVPPLSVIRQLMKTVMASPAAWSLSTLREQGSPARKKS